MASSKMGKKRVENSAKSKADLSLEDVLELGGQKKDYELLENVDEDDLEVFDVGEDLEAEPIKKDEVRSFIQELGFDKIMQDVTEEEEEPAQTKKKTKDKGTPEKSAQTKKKAKDKGAAVQPQTAATAEDAPKKKSKSKNKFKLQDEEVSSTTSPAHSVGMSSMSQYQPRKYLLFKPGGKWSDHMFSKDTLKFEAVSSVKAQQLEKLAAKIMENEVTVYREQQGKAKRSGQAWLRTVLASGTVTDKVAALTVQIQESPIHNLTSIDTLLTMVRKKGKREALQALDTVKDLFLSDLLLRGKKLKAFDQHPLGEVETLASGNRDSLYRRLLIWYYEAQLKERYAQFVKGVELLVHDQLPAAKKKAVGVVFEMLAANPEQEKLLLTLLVNKLGDPDYKVASRAAHLLGRMVERHPNMKTVMVLEVERLLYRAHISAKAQYYAVCFLNQLLLNQQENSLASRLITIYFSFFKSYVKKGEVDSKMLSALLTGVNRAYPYAKVDRVTIEEQMNTLYKIVHIVNFNTSVQALMLLYQVTDASESVSDRYYMALYKKLLDPELQHSSKQAMFLNLLYKSIRKDVVDRRVKAFLKRLLQVCCHHSPTFVCGALILVSEICKGKADLLNMKKMSEDPDDDDDDEHFTDVKTNSEDEAEEEDGEGEGDISGDVQKALSHEGHTTAPSWVHRKNLPGRPAAESYDPLHRNPLYCQAENECVWELRKLAGHYHPSVALFAQTLLKRQEVVYTGDPLQDFTLIRFLDRFVYRNPKKKDKVTSESTRTLGAKHKEYMTSGVRALPVNSSEYLQLGVEKIPVDERFFHRFFSQQAARSSGKATDDQDSDAGSVDDEEFDDFLDKYDEQLDGGDDFKFDFAGEFSKGSGRKKGQRSAEEDDSDDDEEEEELSDEEMDFDDDEDFKQAFESAEDENEDSGEESAEGEMDEEQPDFDEEDVAFSDEEEPESGMPGAGQRKRKAGSEVSLGKPKKAKSHSPAGLFAAAEEFAHLIDEGAGSKLDMTGTEALSNKDNASAKQLNWEMKRDKKSQAGDWRAKKGKARGKQGGRPTMAGKNKRFKRK